MVWWILSRDILFCLTTKCNTENLRTIEKSIILLAHGANFRTERTQDKTLALSWLKTVH